VERIAAVAVRRPAALRHPAPAADEGAVTTFVRVLLPSLRARAATLRCRPIALGLVLSAIVAPLLSAAPASAVVTELEGTKVGLQPREVADFDNGVTSGEFRNVGGGPVLPSTHTYVIYWEPKDNYHADWQRIIDNFFTGVAASSGSLANVFSVAAQYTDPANQHALYQSTALGSYQDVNAYPTSGNCTDPSPLHGGKALTCLTDAQIREQLETFITQHALPKGLGTVYYLLTPPGVAVCLSADHCSDYPSTPEQIEADEEKHEEPSAYKIYKQSFCSYHSDINPDKATDGDASTVLYAVIPWVAGGAGDLDLAPADRNQAYECQDGAFFFNAETSATEKESPKVTALAEAEKRLAAEKKEVQELTAYEEELEKGLISKPELEAKRAALEARQVEREVEERKAREAREASEGPHEQEPNQIGRGEDGGFDTGLADLIVSQIGVEQQNIVTDPLLNGWQDTAGKESTDECRNLFSPYEGGLSAAQFTDAGLLFNQVFGTQKAYVNDAFDLAAIKEEFPGVPCIDGVILKPEFNQPSPVNAGELIGFDGMGSGITLDAGVKYSASGKAEPNYPTFTWSFGDGTPEVSGYAPGAPSANSPAVTPCEEPWLSPCAASSFHAYKYGGTYTVTLTITDVGGNTASVTHEVTVDGPLAPGSGGGSSSGGSGGGSSSTGTGGSGSGSVPGGSTLPAAVPAPVALASVVRQSLHTALRKGLVVSYSVNEQVAGHFEVLLSSALAHKLHVSGTAATGLPAGSPPELVIAKAILVTTKGGRSAVHIQFPKRTAARLAHQHKLSLMLRLIVRNAAPGGAPATSTTTTSVTLDA
jgi:hypothetical protein